MSIRSRAPDVRMSSPLTTVTTAGLSLSRVAANDATWVVACASSRAVAAASASGVAAPGSPAGVAASVVAGGAALSTLSASSARALADEQTASTRSADDINQDRWDIFSSRNVPQEGPRYQPP